MVYGPGESPVEVGPNGTALISRDAKEVFRPETIASFEGKAFTIKHPEDFVNPGNWGVLAKGVTQNVRRGTGEHANSLLADILVNDVDAIALVKGGVREVSCGYECEYVQTGIGIGTQTNIIGNHVALVEQGRAGSTYAINDQQGAKMSKLSEKIKGIFAKAGDEAAKVVDESSKPAVAAGEEIPKWAEKFMTTVKDAMTAVAEGSQPSKMADEDEEKPAKKADKKSEDEGGEEGSRLDKLEAKVDALIEKLSKGADEEEMMDEDKDADKDKSKDKDEECADEEGEAEDADEEESEDDDFEKTPAADEKSRIEVLAPGAKFSGKDAKRKALMKAFEAKDSKQVIMNLCGGKAIDLKKASQKTIDHLFIGASEVVGLYRTKDFSKWKQVRDSQADVEYGAGEGKTPDQINEINKKFFANKEGAH